MNTRGFDVLGIRLDPGLERKLVAIARQQKRTKSEVAREAIRRYVESATLVEEARRQSLLASAEAAESEAAEFIDHAVDFG